MKHILRKSAAALVAAFLFISCGKNQAVKNEMFAPMAKSQKSLQTLNKTLENTA